MPDVFLAHLLWAWPQMIDGRMRMNLLPGHFLHPVVLKQAFPSSALTRTTEKVSGRRMKTKAKIQVL